VLTFAVYHDHERLLASLLISIHPNAYIHHLAHATTIPLLLLHITRNAILVLLAVHFQGAQYATR
jgi:hypothetical protein